MKPRRRMTFTLILLGLAALAVGLRLYRINAPIADWHSFRQADTAAVARNFLKFGFDPLHPRYDDLSNIQSGMDNPQGYRMVEFPMYQLTAAALTRYVPIFPVEVWLRIISIACQAGSLVLLAVLVRRYAGTLSAYFAAFLFAVLPYNVYYGRTILPDVPAMFFALVSVFAMDTYFQRHSRRFPFSAWFLISALSSAAALLVKPTAAFLLLPNAYLMLRHFSLRKRWFFFAVAYAFIMLFPLAWWRTWISQFPEGIPVYAWLFNNKGIRFKGAWFYWLFAERIGNLILGYWGLFPFVLGMWRRASRKEGWFFRYFIIGSFLYLAVVAGGNVQHDYYQILIVPTLVVYAAKGYAALFETERGRLLPALTVAAVVFLFSWAFSYYTIRTYYWINSPQIVDAGRAADTLLPEDAKVIAPYNGDTAFLYQTNRQGWPIGFDIDKKILMGATAYVSIHPDDPEPEALAKSYRVLTRTDTYEIIDLTRPR